MKASGATGRPATEAPLERAWDLARVGRSDEALTLATTVNIGARVSQDMALECRSSTDIAWYCLQIGESQRGLQHARTAAAIARKLGDVTAEAKARALKAWLLSEIGITEDAIEEAMLALGLAEPAGNAEVLSLALNVVGVILWLCRQPDRAIEFCSRAVAMAREIGDRVVLGWWLINLGGSQAELAYAAKNRNDEETFWRAIEDGVLSTEEAMRLAEAEGDPWGLRICLGNLAEYHVVCEDYGGAKEILDRYDKVIGGDYKRNREHYLYTLGQTLTHLGRHEEAIEHLVRAIDIGEETGNVDAVSHAAEYLADVYEKRGDHERALAAHRRFHDAYVRLSAERAQRQARLAEVRYEFGKLRSAADAESRRAREMTAIAEGLRQARTAAEQASKAKSRFLASMSHELRTPLNAIIGFSDVMRMQIFGEIQPLRYSEYVKVIHDSAQHLLSLINDLLDLSRIEAGKLELDIKLVEVASLNSAIKVLMSQMADGRGVELEIADPEVSVLWADERAIRQILLNLVSNAIKFTRAGGRVTLEFRPGEAGGVDVVVSDTGIGLTDEEIEIALRPYGQVHANLLVREEGTGLGLPMVKGLAELHGGFLKLISSKGEGTSAIVHLPGQS